MLVTKLILLNQFEMYNFITVSASLSNLINKKKIGFRYQIGKRKKIMVAFQMLTLLKLWVDRYQLLFFNVEFCTQHLYQDVMRNSVILSSFITESVGKKRNILCETSSWLNVAFVSYKANLQTCMCLRVLYFSSTSYWRKTYSMAAVQPNDFATLTFEARIVRIHFDKYNKIFGIMQRYPASYPEE